MRIGVIPGQKFGRLTAVAPTGQSQSGMKTWICVCDCGQQATVIGNNLSKGNTKSCGCLSRDKSAGRMAALNLKHGATKTRLFKIWTGIVDRTTNPNHDAYERYGGRGIVLSEGWRDFAVFAAAVGEPPSAKHSIDRIDNEKGYEPGNVRWVLAQQQAENRRTNRFVSVRGDTLTFAAAARRLGVSKSTITRRVDAGLLTEVHR